MFRFLEGREEERREERKYGMNKERNGEVKRFFKMKCYSKPLR